MLSTLYICDKCACNDCNKKSHNGCKHTTKLHHAVHEDSVYRIFEVYSSGDRTVLAELSNNDLRKKYEHPVSM